MSKLSEDKFNPSKVLFGGSVVEIDLSRFDYESEAILDELLKPQEFDESTVMDNDFFNLPVSEEYKNNQERIQREEELKRMKEESDNKTESVIVASEK